MTDIACQELVELVTQYLDGVLGPDQTEQINRHLESCEGCEAYISQIRATIRIADNLDPEPTTEETIDQQLIDLHRQWLAGRAHR